MLLNKKMSFERPGLDSGFLVGFTALGDFQVAKLRCHKRRYLLKGDRGE